jgi:hypothetical protein
MRRGVTERTRIAGGASLATSSGLQFHLLVLMLDLAGWSRPLIATNVAETHMAVVGDIDHLSTAISHATAPAFMLGAVAGFLSILIARMERIVDRNRSLRSGDLASLEPSVRKAIAESFSRRMELLGWAIYFAVLSALVTAALLISAFLAALVGFAHGGLVAVMFVVALALLMASLVDLAREIRVHIATMGLD